MLEVAQFHAALADADHRGERHAGGLVAHIGAVRQVVRPIGPREELVEKSGFIAGPAGGVKDGLVGRGQELQLIGDQAERVLPPDRLVVARSGPEHHGLGEPALVPEPVLGPGRQVRHGMFAEKIPRQVLRRRLICHRLEAVFAEFREAAFIVRIGPRAALAVESIRLVQLVKRAQRVREAGLPEPVLGHLFDRLQAGGDLVALALLQPLEFDGRLRPRGMPGNSFRGIMGRHTRLDGRVAAVVPVGVVVQQLGASCSTYFALTTWPESST